MKCLTLILFVFSFYLPAEALGRQFSSGDEARQEAWATITLGKDAEGTGAGGLYLSLGRSNLFQLGVDLVQDDEGSGFFDVHLSFGRSLVRGRWRHAFFLGPGFVYGADSYETSYGRDSDEFTTVGATINGQVIYKPIQKLGFGATAFSMISPEKSSAAIGLSIIISGDY